MSQPANPNPLTQVKNNDNAPAFGPFVVVLVVVLVIDPLSSPPFPLNKIEHDYDDDDDDEMEPPQCRSTPVNPPIVQSRL